MLRASMIAFMAMTATAAWAEPAKTPMFNGKDLTGWVGFLDRTGPNVDGHMKTEDVFKVKEGGVIAVTGVPYGYIRTVKPYTNMHVTLEFRWPQPDHPGRKNGGLLLRGFGPDSPDTNPRASWLRSYEAEIAEGRVGEIFILTPYPVDTVRSDPKFIDQTTGQRFGPQYAGRQRKIHTNAEKPFGEWNTFDVVLDGDHMVITVNGVKVNEAWGLEVKPGYISLQSEGGPIEYRNVRITPLD